MKAKRIRRGSYAQFTSEKWYLPARASGETVYSCVWPDCNVFGISVAARLCQLAFSRDAQDHYRDFYGPFGAASVAAEATRGVT
jgi:hypothetical protein